jgi:subtilase family serine protease
MDRSRGHWYSRPAISVLSAPALGGPFLAEPLFAAPAAASSNPVPIGSRPMIPPGAADLGATPGNMPIQVTVALNPSDPAKLAAMATAVSTPGNPLFHHYLSAAQFRATFAPSTAKVSGLRAALAGAGLRLDPVTANGLSFSVNGTSAAIGRAFHTTFHSYRLPDGGSGYASSGPAALPPNLAGLVQAVAGLSSLTSAHDHVIPSPAPSITSAAAPRATAAPGESACAGAAGVAHTYDAARLATAYGFDGLYQQGDAGSNVVVALYELAGFDSGDIASFQSCYGLDVPIEVIPVDGGAAVGAGTLEAELDIEDLISLAPKLSKVEVYEAPNTGSDGLDEYEQIASDDSAQVVSTSWGACEADLTSGTASAENTVFEEMATAGQTVVAAAGDDGSEDCYSSSSASSSSQLAVEDPASQPYVTGVGGTSMSAADYPPTETVWNDGASSVEGAGVGGTSGSTPLWAALMADINSGCQSDLGFANPALYSAAALCADPTPKAPSFYRDTPPTSATVGQPYSYAFAATGQPLPTYTASGALPAGLSLDKSTGVLTGTPTEVGGYSFTITATNGVSPAAITPIINVAVSAAPTEQLVFTTGPLSGDTSSPASATLGPITLGLQSVSTGSPISAGAGGLTVDLSSTSSSGVFSATDGGPTTDAVTIPAGSSQVTFYYGDSSAGSPTITASAVGAEAASQSETLTAPPPPGSGSGSGGSLLSSLLNSLLGLLQGL